MSTLSCLTLLLASGCDLLGDDKGDDTLTIEVTNTTDTSPTIVVTTATGDTAVETVPTTSIDGTYTGQCAAAEATANTNQLVSLVLDNTEADISVSGTLVSAEQYEAYGSFAVVLGLTGTGVWTEPTMVLTIDEVDAAGDVVPGLMFTFDLALNGTTLVGQLSGSELVDPLPCELELQE